VHYSFKVVAMATGVGKHFIDFDFSWISRSDALGQNFIMYASLILVALSLTHRHWQNQ
jgi:hypothetical protein